jgi:hypothetical protein
MNYMCLKHLEIALQNVFDFKPRTAATSQKLLFSSRFTSIHMRSRLSEPRVPATEPGEILGEVLPQAFNHLLQRYEDFQQALIQRCYIDTTHKNILLPILLDTAFNTSVSVRFSSRTRTEIYAAFLFIIISFESSF